MAVALEVLFPIPTPAFSYILPFDAKIPKVGVRVVVPWQRGLRIGLLVGIDTVSDSKALELKQIIAVLDEKPFVLPKQISFLLELARVSCSTPGLLLSILLATGLNEELRHEVKAVAAIDDIAVPQYYIDAARVERIDILRENGLIDERVDIIRPKQRVLKAFKEPDDRLSGKAQKNQLIALEKLRDYEYLESAAELSRQAGVPPSAVSALIKKGYIGYFEVDAPEPALISFPAKEISYKIDYIANHDYTVISGGYREQRLAAVVKTIKRDLENGKSVMVFVPELGLLEQTAAYLLSKFPVLILSGELSDKQRKRFWHEVGLEPTVIVCNYFGMLAPAYNLGRIIVLDESSNSYKMSKGPLLFIPNALKALAKKLKIPIILTDCLITAESLARVVYKKAEHYKIPYPTQRLYFSNILTSANWPLSTQLLKVLIQVKERDRQAIIISPRRGYSAALGCADCGEILSCPNCDLSLRYHKQEAKLRCHQCGKESDIPQTCPSCKGYNLKAMRGAGTEWMIRAVKEHLGDFPVYRYDRDVKNDLSPLEEGKPGVVVATTAILRYPPLPNVSLLALGLFDSFLSYSDFRAEEEGLRIILNMIELSPQKQALTLIQSFQLEHKVFKVLAASDKNQAVNEFMKSVLKRRHKYMYPPFVNIAKIQISAKDKLTAFNEAERIAKTLSLHFGNKADYLGPSPAPIFRMRSFYNYQIFVRDLKNKGFDELLLPIVNYRGRARVRIDIDPREIGGFLE